MERIILSWAEFFEVGKEIEKITRTLKKLGSNLN